MFFRPYDGSLGANRHQVFQWIALSIETWELWYFEIWWDLSIP
jgi:hypothetical protein